jgi:putative transposase
MPRIPRGQAAGYVYHIINRGNGRSEIFHKSQDYQAFLDLLAAAKKRQPVKVLAFCLMPNHFHLVLEPAHTTALSKFMQWLLTSHVRRYHRHYRSSGHIWQGRFKSFPIQRDEHLLTSSPTTTPFTTVPDSSSLSTILGAKYHASKAM